MSETKTNHYQFSMALSAYQLEAYYDGSVKNVVVICDNGQTLQLPINVFKRYVTRMGVHGRFTVYVDENHKFMRIEKCE